MNEDLRPMADATHAYRVGALSGNLTWGRVDAVYPLKDSQGNYLPYLQIVCERETWLVHVLPKEEML